MKKLLTILLILSGFTCHPYRAYYFTHYHIKANYDPEKQSLTANVQMVFVPGQAFRDSIAFRLNESMAIRSLSAQELKYYAFENGRLVLYIDEVVMPGDQLHVSMTYEGRVGAASGDESRSAPVAGQGLLAESLWYPVSPGTDRLTYTIAMKLPVAYELGSPAVRKGQHWYWGTELATGSIAMPQLRESRTGQ